MPEFNDEQDGADMYSESELCEFSRSRPPFERMDAFGLRPVLSYFPKSHASPRQEHVQVDRGKVKSADVVSASSIKPDIFVHPFFDRQDRQAFKRRRNAQALRKLTEKPSDSPVIEWAWTSPNVPRSLFWRAMRLHRPPTIFSAVADDSARFVGARSVVNMEEPWWQFGLQCARDLFWHGG